MKKFNKIPRGARGLCRLFVVEKKYKILKNFSKIYFFHKKNKQGAPMYTSLTRTYRLGQGHYQSIADTIQQWLPRAGPCHDKNLELFRLAVNCYNDFHCRQLDLEGDEFAALTKHYISMVCGTMLIPKDAYDWKTMEKLMDEIIHFLKSAIPTKDQYYLKSPNKENAQLVYRVHKRSVDEMMQKPEFKDTMEQFIRRVGQKQCTKQRGLRSRSCNHKRHKIDMQQTLVELRHTLGLV